MNVNPVQVKQPEQALAAEVRSMSLTKHNLWA